MLSEQRFKLIKELTECQGISGKEAKVRALIKKHLEPSVDKIEISPLGNIFGIKNSKNHEGPKIMLAAHMDEVGFMIKRIRKNGLFEVLPIGGWNPYTVSAQRFTLQTHKGDYPVVSSSVPPHLLRGNKDKALELKVEDILFDAGFSSAEEATTFGVRPGDAIVPQSETIYTANKENIIAKSWDNRYGCAVMIETMQEIKGMSLSSTIIAGASVQEEVGLRGIRGAVYQYQPDLFLAVDCSPAQDFSQEGDTMGELGKGFLLRMQDPGFIMHKGLCEYLLDTAETAKIPYQYYFSKGGTDASAAHTMNQGIISGVIGVPGRYIHGHQTIFNISDYEAAKAMVLEICKTFDQTTLNTIRERG